MHRRGYSVKIHIVQKGDTLWKLAKKYGVSFDELKKINSQLSNPDLLMPGMKIKIPGSAGTMKKEAVQPIIKTGTKEVPVQPQVSGLKEQLIKKEQPIMKEQPIVKEIPIVKEKPIVKEQPIMKEYPIAPPTPTVIEKEVVKEKPIYVTKEVPKEVVKEKPIYITKEVVKEKPVYITKEVIKEKPIYITKEVPAPPPLPVPEVNKPIEEIPVEECIPVTPILPGTGFCYPAPPPLPLQWEIRSCSVRSAKFTSSTTLCSSSTGGWRKLRCMGRIIVAISIFSRIRCWGKYLSDSSALSKPSTIIVPFVWKCANQHIKWNLKIVAAVKRI